MKKAIIIILGIALFAGIFIYSMDWGTVKSEIEKIPLFDKTIRLALVRAARLFWGLRKKSLKTTIVSET